MKFETKNEYRQQDQLDLSTLELKTSADLVKVEKQLLSYWDRLKLVELVKEKNKSGTKFSFFDGPVTANNPLGVHHAWGRTLKDVVQRYKALRGFDQRFQYGFDTQGLWVEVEVEKALGFNSKKELQDFGLNQFVDACKDRVYHFAAVQDQQSGRLGMLKSADSYFTHTDQNISAIWHFLKTCHDKGWLYQKSRPMPWCPRCGTSLSSHEQVDSYSEVRHLAVYAKFPIDQLENAYFVVWTTTPWTLPANQAVAVHPDKTYGFYQAESGEVYVGGLWLQNSVFEEMKLLRTMTGRELSMFSYTTAFHNLPAQTQNVYEVVTWDEVTTDEGTGVVHLAPGCGREDFDLLADSKLTPLSPLTEDGKYSEGYGTLSAKDYQLVNTEVVQYLTDMNLLFKTEQYVHRYPHCWRCKTNLVYRLVDEWFVSVDQLRSQLLQAADEVTWNPGYTKSLFEDWVRNMDDWCVSRKRYWGLPLPFYPCSCGHLTVVGSKEEFLQHAVGKVESVSELHLPWVDMVKYPCDNCGLLNERVPEVGDCWLDAGVMPFSTLDYFDTSSNQFNDWFPADFVCEMREQVRLWFYSMMFLSMTLTGKIPFTTVLSYEMVRDKNNEEMHKTGKNNVNLNDALDHLGGDTLRLYYLMQNRSSNMRFDFAVAEQLGKVLMTLYHSSSFFQQYADLDSFKYENVESENLLDRWILSRLGTATTEYMNLMDTYQFNTVVKLLENLVFDLSNWYLRRVRTRVWNKSGSATDGVFHTLFLVFKQLSVLFAPFTPFFAEVLYQKLRSYDATLNQSVHLEDLEQPFVIDHDLMEHMGQLRVLAELNRQLRAKHQLKLRQPLSNAYVLAPVDLSEEELQLLEEVLTVKNVDMMAEPMKYVNFDLRPVYDKLGPKYGADVNQVAELLTQLDQKQAHAFVFGDMEEMDLGSFVLQRNEVEVRMVPRDQFDLEAEGSTVLFLDLTLDKELQVEGFVKDFKRQIQQERKLLDLGVEQRVKLTVQTSTDLRKELRKYRTELLSELVLSNFEIKQDIRTGKEFNHQLGNLRYHLTT